VLVEKRRGVELAALLALQPLAVLDQILVPLLHLNALLQLLAPALRLL
jgi:hypothetical protein